MTTRTDLPPGDAPSSAGAAWPPPISAGRRSSHGEGSIAPAYSASVGASDSTSSSRASRWSYSASAASPGPRRGPSMLSHPSAQYGDWPGCRSAKRCRTASEGLGSAGRGTPCAARASARADSGAPRARWRAEWASRCTAALHGRAPAADQLSSNVLGLRSSVRLDDHTERLVRAAHLGVERRDRECLRELPVLVVAPDRAVEMNGHDPPGHRHSIASRHASLWDRFSRAQGSSPARRTADLTVRWVMW